MTHVETKESLGIKIGLEVHVQLTALKTKLFCGCDADYRSAPPNTHTCPICLGLPGSLPVVNEKAVECIIKIALALNCKIITDKEVRFFRKNYFYPDLPKGYQISQYDRAGGFPVAVNGTVEVNGKKIRIRRVHMEEDPGKLSYEGSLETSQYVLVDYNRSGIALVEIVTEPDLRSPREARVFLQKLRTIIETLEVADFRLEGSLRCDANISLKGGERVEVKNISSYKDVERALNYETLRQKSALSKEQTIEQETRHWDEVRRVTYGSRIKEMEHEYRYFNEADIPSLIFSKDIIEKTAKEMPELPDQRKTRLIQEYDIPPYDAGVLTGNKHLADIFENCVKLYPHPKTVSNWLMTDFLRYVGEHDLEIEEVPITPNKIVKMLQLIDKGIISGKIAKKILKEMLSTGKDPEKIIEEHGLTRIHDEKEIEKVCEETFNENPKAVKDAKKDKKAINYLVGKIMEKTKGRADPKITQKIVKKMLKENREEPTAE
ncbi:MAG: Asp-tRNA(Asn)/Glu-tRNA(Gln) amidotransferase subunit GatB [Candidatus Wukongarchaeota archaeon]|nr:Asp-tRNA(Asn)/Glu-tRNA(Gln) amidotransferase subunit GatB [Candidatus Wukongarchaeota archaeon]